MSRLPADERGLWRRAMHDVAPLRGRSSAPAPELLVPDPRASRPPPPPLPAAGTAAVQAAGDPIA